MERHPDPYCYHQSRALHNLDHAIYQLWRQYGYSNSYWQLEQARLNFERYAAKIDEEGQ